MQHKSWWRFKSPESLLYHSVQSPWREQTFDIWGFCRILWTTPLIHLFHLEEILLQLLTLVLTWIHYEPQRSNQPRLSLANPLRPPFWLFLHYFTNPSYCPINQSKCCGCRRPQEWTNRDLYSRPSFSPPPSHSIFFPKFSSSPTPSPLYTC